MQKKTSITLGICGLATALLCFFWWRGAHDAENSAATKDPTPAEALARTQASLATNKNHYSSLWERRLAARGNSKDQQSTVETFKESGNCLYYFLARSAASTDYANEESASEMKLLWQSVREQTAPLCRGANEEAVARAFMAAVFEAAKQGNPDAQSCFIISTASLPTRNFDLNARYRKYLQERYIKYAPALIQSALERGDPYVSHALIGRHFPAGFVVDNPRVEEMIPPPDPYLTFRAEQLALYRVPPKSLLHADIEDNLNQFIGLEILSDDEIVRAEDWAKATYAQKFANMPPIDPSKQTPCHSIKGDAP